MKKRVKLMLFLTVAAVTALCYAACGSGADGGSTADNAGSVVEEIGGGSQTQEEENGQEEQDPEQEQEQGAEQEQDAEQELEPEQGADSEQTEESTSSVLVAYFSATGNTRPLAEYAASYTGATLYEIEAKVPYMADDLKYYTDCRADREQSDPAARPEIGNLPGDISGYNVIFIGYPIWHGQAPKIIYTFLESYDFSGKTIIPFCTSASSPLGTSATNLHTSASTADWKDGRRFDIGTSEADIQAWIDGLDLEVKKENTVKVYCNNNVLDIELADNPSAKAFYEKLKDGDVSVDMHDYGDFEKVGPLGFLLVQSNTQITTEPGDVILYQGNNITIYYDENTWNFTLLGKIKGMTRESMLAFFGGKGDVTVTFSLK